MRSLSRNSLPLTAAFLARSSFLAAHRWSSTGAPSSSSKIAPKKMNKKKIEPRLNVSALLKNVPTDPGAYGELSTSELERKVEEWAKLNPRKLEEMVQSFESREEESSKVLVEDSVHQMEVSLAPRSQGATKVFWKQVDVLSLEKEGYPNWFTVTVDGRRVKAFESKTVLAIPSEPLAYACAVEYGEQEGYLNKLLMPLTDICSGALHIAPQMLEPRIDYLLSFFQNDNLYFRAPVIAAEQDNALQPILEWWEKTFEVKVPRVVGIGYPRISPEEVALVRSKIISMNLNPYQILTLCVTAQFTSSLILPFSLFFNIIDVPTAIRINRAEEAYNADTIGAIEGYHDIREADVVTKVAACATVWQLTKTIGLSKSLEVPRATALTDDFAA